MAESVPHVIELGWSEAKCGWVQVRPDGGVDIAHDGPDAERHPLDDSAGADARAARSC